MLLLSMGGFRVCVEVAFCSTRNLSYSADPAEAQTVMPILAALPPSHSLADEGLDGKPILAGRHVSHKLRLLNISEG